MTDASITGPNLGDGLGFRRSRLSVLHIGKMAEGGERVENILEDYPYLNEDDIKYAVSYYRAASMKTS